MPLKGSEEGFHPAVQLMLARMDTHPEEFRPRGYRWEEHLDAMLEASSPEERAALTTKLNRFRMDTLHEEVMADLLDGNQKPKVVTGGNTSLQEALMSYRNAAGPPVGMGNALRNIFK
jgi:hypothetical protein